MVKSLYYWALASAADIAAFSPTTLLRQPPKFALDLSLIGSARLIDFGGLFAFGRPPLRKVEGRLFPNSLVRYKHLGGMCWTITDKTDATINEHGEMLLLIAKQARLDLPADSYFTPDAIDCCGIRRRDFSTHHFAYCFFEKIK